MKAKRKSDLPEKICPVCLRAFAWRRKWASCWDEVRYCSDRCRGQRGRTNDRTSDRALGEPASQ